MVAVVEIDPGVCGHLTTVRATGGEAYRAQVSLESTCPHVQKMAAEVSEVDALQQIVLRGAPSPVLNTAYRHLAHAACPVPSGLVKAIELAAGLALPQDVTMRIKREE